MSTGGSVTVLLWVITIFYGPSANYYDLLQSTALHGKIGNGCISSPRPQETKLFSHDLFSRQAPFFWTYLEITIYNFYSFVLRKRLGSMIQLSKNVVYPHLTNRRWRITFDKTKLLGGFLAPAGA